jgi:transcriptional regulator with XRE-family HTH domain
MDGGSHDLDQVIGARLRLRRVERGLAEGAVAEAAGIACRQLQRYEQGLDGIPTSIAVHLAKVLDCSFAWLIGEDVTAPDAATAMLLTQEGAIELLALFERLDPSARARIITLVSSVAGPDAPGEAASMTCAGLKISA